MSLMSSLCAALERAGGDRLVMRAGERPHVLAGEHRHDVASAVLSVNAVEALAEQILSNDGLATLASNGSVSETVTSPSFPHPLTARAERVGDDFYIELIVTSAVETLASVPQVEETAAPEPEIAEPEPAPTPPTPEPTAAYEEPTSRYEEPASRHEEPAARYEEPVSPYEESGPRPEPKPVEQPPVMSAHTERSEPLHADVRVVTRMQDPPKPPRAAAFEPLDLFGWISQAAQVGATTLYLRAGAQAAARIDDRIQSLGPDPVDPDVIDSAAASFTRGGDGLWQPRPDGEWVRDDDELGYVTCRVFTDMQGTGLIANLRPATTLRLLYKHIPRQVRTACEGNGLVVVTASSEADVEALAAAVADWSGRDRGGYLISLQRRSQSHGEIAGAFVSQRTVGGSEKDFASAIRRAAQECPDILLVTGIQSEQALQAAVLAAAGGRLVIVGVVSSTTAEGLKMLAGSDSHVRRALSASFRAAIGYRSLRRIGGGRTLVQDVLLPTEPVCALIEAGNFDGLARTQMTGAQGMRSVDESLARAVRRGQVSLREAAAHAVDRSHMVALVRASARAQRLAQTGDSGRGRSDHGMSYGGLRAAAGGRYS